MLTYTIIPTNGTSLLILTVLLVIGSCLDRYIWSEKQRTIHARTQAVATEASPPILWLELGQPSVATSMGVMHVHALPTLLQKCIFAQVCRSELGRVASYRVGVLVPI